MRIAHIQHPFIPGMGYQENNLPKAQTDLGHEVKIFTSDINPSQRGNTENKYSRGVENYSGVDVIRLSTWHYFKSIDNVLLKNLTRELKQFRPDIIHSHGSLSPHLMQVVPYTKATSTPIVVDDHVDDDNFNIDSSIKQVAFNIYKYTIFSWMKTEIDEFLPITKYSRRFLVNKLEVNKDATTMLPLGVDQSNFYPDDSKKRKYRAKLNIPQDAFVVVTAGHQEERKQTGQIIEAVSKLVGDGVNAYLLIVGPGPDDYITSLKRKSITADIEGRTIFYGFASHNELVGLFNSADVGVWPGIGISIIEAIGTGLPVVIGDNLATEHLVKHSNGISFDRSNTSELISALEKFIYDPEFTTRASQSAIEFVENELSWNAIAQDSIEIYQNAISSSAN